MNAMKRFTCLMLSAIMLMLTLSLSACNESEPNPEPDITTQNQETDVTTQPTTDNSTTTQNPTQDQETDVTTQPTTDNSTETQNPTQDQEPVNDKVSLDGKRVIFIGNSHTYYGKTVISKSGYTQAQRENDQGMFYQLCRLKGMDVSVTNWTFASHNLPDTFESCSKCNNVTSHQEHLTNRNYDYVIMQEGSASASSESFLAICDKVINFFKEANPDVKIILTLSTRAVDGNYNWLPAVEELEKTRGVTIVDLGHLVWDVVDGKTAVPGATMTYNKNSFIICKSASDGYHPNLLTGYLTSLFVYCAITGESAVGQPYSFAIDKNVHSQFNPTTFINTYYTYNNPTTNFHLALRSESDMKGFQELVDRYLSEKNYISE